MNRKRTLLFLALALLSGAVAGFSALRYMRGRPAAPARTEVIAGTQVIVAARDLPLGTVVGPADVTMVRWPDHAVPLGYARTVPDVVGRGVIAPMSKNEPFLDTKLADKAAGGGLPIVIPEGKRAVSVRVDEVISVAGFVLPSTRVDVLLTIAPEGQQMITQVVLQNVQVLAAGQVIQRDEQGKPIPVTVITLLVDPLQAEKLVLASTQGRIQLALRNTLDMKSTPVPGVRVPALLSGAVESGPTRRIVRPAAGGQERTGSVEVFRGGVRTLKSF